MKIGFFELEGWEESVISGRLSSHDIFFSADKIDEYNLPKERDFEIISIFIDSRINKKVIESFPNLKFIATRSTGFDHINIEDINAGGILASHVPGYGEHTVAEFTFGLMLNLSRKIYLAIDRIKEAGSFSLKDLRGRDLHGKTLGVVGTGRIGKRVIEIAKGFSMNVIAYDLYPDTAFEKEAGIKYVPFEDLLKNADIITFHCPHNKSTHHLINKGNIATIKKGALLVNTARGGIIETEAMVDGLNKGILGGVALDVLEEEGEVKDELDFLAKEKQDGKTIRNMLYDHILMEMPNVLITPHTAFNSQEALEEILETTLQNIEGFINGKPINLISGKK